MVADVLPSGVKVNDIVRINRCSLDNSNHAGKVGRVIKWLEMNPPVTEVELGEYGRCWAAEVEKYVVPRVGQLVQVTGCTNGSSDHNGKIGTYLGTTEGNTGMYRVKLGSGPVCYTKEVNTDVERESGEDGGGPAVRPVWHDTWMRVAHAVAPMGTCPRLQVAAIAVNPMNQVVLTCYNGAPAGQAHCTEVGCLMVGGHCKRAVHAEMNLIVWSARLGRSLRGCTIYTTHRACITCAPLLIAAGVHSIVYAAPYHTDGSLGEVEDLCSAAGVLLRDYTVMVGVSRG